MRRLTPPARPWNWPSRWLFGLWSRTSRGYREGYAWGLAGNTISNKPFAGSQVSDAYYYEWQMGFSIGEQDALSKP